LRDRLGHPPHTLNLNGTSGRTARPIQTSRTGRPRRAEPSRDPAECLPSRISS
jgi:hypothetical protein